MLKIPEELTLFKALDTFNELYFTGNKENDLGYDDFATILMRLFDIEDLEEYDIEAKTMINQAILDLFNAFDVNDNEKLTLRELENGFSKILPDISQEDFEIIQDPQEYSTVVEIFNRIDAEEIGLWNLENFEIFLSKFVKNKNDLKNVARMFHDDADKNNSGAVSKIEFINWSKGKGYLHFINLLEGKGIPYSLDDSPRSIEGTTDRDLNQRNSNSQSNMNSQRRLEKDAFIHGVFVNKNKKGMSQDIKELSTKKTQDFSEFFKSPEFRAAIKDINSLANSSGLYKIYPLDLIKFIDKVLKDYEEGFREEDFIKCIFSFYKNEKLTYYQRKIRENALRKIFEIIDVDGNNIADHIELSECLIFLWGGSIEEKIESAFSLFDVEDTKTFTFDEFTDFLGVTFRIFLNFLSLENPYYKQLDYRELTEQTADKCFSDLQKSPAGEISHHELMYWVCGKKMISEK